MEGSPVFSFLLLVVHYWSIAREPGSPTRVLRFSTISSDDQRQVSINDSNIINIDCDMQQNSGHKFVSDFNRYVTLSNSGSPGDPTLTTAHYSSFSMDGEFSVIFCDAQQRSDLVFLFVELFEIASSCRMRGGPVMFSSEKV